MQYLSNSPRNRTLDFFTAYKHPSSLLSTLNTFNKHQDKILLKSSTGNCQSEHLHGFDPRFRLMTLQRSTESCGFSPSTLHSHVYKITYLPKRSLSKFANNFKTLGDEWNVIRTGNNIVLNERYFLLETIKYI